MSFKNKDELKKTESGDVGSCTPKSTAEGFIYSSQNIETSPGALVNEWVSKMCYMRIGARTMEYCPALKRNKIRTHVTTWGDIENVGQVT